MRIVAILSVLTCANAFSPIAVKSTSSTTSLNQYSRKDFLQSALVTAAGSAAVMVGGSSAAWADETLPSGVVVNVIKSGDGAKPGVGELAAIRFSAYAGDNKIDDIFDTPEPYYTRVGSGGMLKGVEEVLPQMRVGDRWKLTIPSNLAFGPKGRPSSAGKPRIPGDMTIIFEVEMTGIPGREPELIELIGD
mmetsp:Transcript_27119/g.45214  ORF Transcript_27119/g.45214 Transcript_27119/m.45214 type:complete len:191 (+) Transcript_27119:62-634(+)|eukprot:CAMPEP_0119014716 /NCGR_PEP_ID=MMETSP1176-20130426/10267_1 /TAXON_ID=265551 /ORGANISM="Synedropsis recta cf, Strain CCMP1620" /LENGTH=190 /DNA_ID=CAMNT_0006967941 /DNA_START=61 /DNA_END=633 /DNA_ORIENTATION=+